MGIVIYDHPFSPYAQKCKIALYEKGVPFETMLPNGVGSGNTDTPFLTANPRGEVPALIDDGFAIFDSSIIVEYIEDKHPTPALLPKSPAERARARMIEEIMDTQYEAINWGLTELVVFKRAEGTEAETIRGRAKEQLTGLYAWLTRELGDKEWLNGTSFGWADMCVIPFVNGTYGFGLAPEKTSALGQWQARCNQRASVKQIRDDIKKTPPMNAPDGVGAAKPGTFKREYRDHRVEWMLRSGGARVVFDGMKNETIRFSNEIE